MRTSWIRIATVAATLSLVISAAGAGIWVVNRQHEIFGFRCLSSSDQNIDAPEAAPLARAVISAAENSSLEWERQANYLEYNVEHNQSENRGYTGGLVGFTSKTHDMLRMVSVYAKRRPDSKLAEFVPALTRVDGTSATDGLGQPFESAWAEAAQDPEFLKSQLQLSDQIYLNPAVKAAHEDGLGRLGQLIYYDALVMHGPGDDQLSFGGIRAEAQRAAKTPDANGSEQKYLLTFLDVREKAMKQEKAHHDTSRILAQRQWVQAKNFALKLPLDWSVYSDRFVIEPTKSIGCLLRI